ncbi:hypothetical protein JOF40_001229 [Aeromicrobium fastidiosum]|nr:hypothetical protein [Aeromicrobium fastidiosum]
MSRDCPTGCGRKAQAGHYMCRSCWSRVPRDLQQRVYATWRAWRKDLGDPDLMRAYRAATDAAEAAIA